MPQRKKGLDSKSGEKARRRKGGHHTCAVRRFCEMLRTCVRTSRAGTTKLPWASLPGKNSCSFATRTSQSGLRRLPISRFSCGLDCWTRIVALVRQKGLPTVYGRPILSLCASFTNNLLQHNISVRFAQTMRNDIKFLFVSARSKNENRFPNSLSAIVHA